MIMLSGRTFGSCQNMAVFTRSLFGRMVYNAVSTCCWAKPENTSIIKTRNINQRIVEDNENEGCCSSATVCSAWRWLSEQREGRIAPIVLDLGPKLQDPRRLVCQQRGQARPEVRRWSGRRAKLFQREPLE